MMRRSHRPHDLTSGPTYQNRRVHVIRVAEPTRSDAEWSPSTRRATGPMTWFETHHAVVHPWMCDRFGHLNVRFYAHIFDDAGFALWPLCGVRQSDFDEAGLHTVVARTETEFKAEVMPGSVVSVRSRIERVGTKSLEYVQELRDVETGRVHATQTVVEVFFDPDRRAAEEIPAPIRSILATLVAE